MARPIENAPPGRRLRIDPPGGSPVGRAAMARSAERSERSAARSWLGPRRWSNSGKTAVRYGLAIDRRPTTEPGRTALGYRDLRPNRRAAGLFFEVIVCA